MYELNDLILLLKSSQPVISIQTHEEDRAIDLVKRCSMALNKPVMQWSVTRGLVDLGTNHAVLKLAGHEETASKTMDAAAKGILKEIYDNKAPGIYILVDFHPFYDDPYVVRAIKDIAQNHSLNRHHLVFISSEKKLPEELNRFSAMFSLSLPDREALHKLILEEVKIWSLKPGNDRLKADKRALELLASNLAGLTTAESRRLIRNAIYNDNAITASDLERVQKAKYELIGQDGVLSFEYETSSFEQVGGLKRLKHWLNVRKNVFLEGDQNRGLEKPKGVLLIGVQGGGKSLAAKAVAGVWGVPLLRMDFGALYNKFIGETEKNMRKALELAELMSPCVLWVDEIEKAISTGDYDSGTSQRLLATLLTWMAENKKPVFIVATANKIDALPPELIRKGRLDEIFFVDLPGDDVREQIFSIHLKKRQVADVDFCLADLSAASAGFSGAEIEQAVVSALYNAHASALPVNQSILLEEIANTNPLSVVMEESITRLREWAMERTVMAD